MKLDDMVAQTLRMFPIFILADSSGSMDGEKIVSLNKAMRDTVDALRTVKGIPGRFFVSVISFGGDEAKILIPLTDIQSEQFTLPELSAHGRTPLGGALTLVAQNIEDAKIVPHNAYQPTILLISDGIPTDRPKNTSVTDWKPMKQMLNPSSRSFKAQRFALAIGADADTEVLQGFIHNPDIPLFSIEDSTKIASFFQWVTMSTIARAKSTNPDDISISVPFDERFKRI